MRTAIDLIVAWPLPDDSPAVRAAKSLAAKGKYADAAKAFPPGSGFERRMCHTLAKWDGHARKSWRTIDQSMRKLYLCAVQSQVFNLVLARRIDRVDRIDAGDVAYKHVNGACFSVEDAATEQPRCDAFEISPTGPLFGPRMKAAAAAPGDAELQALTYCGLTPADFEKKEKFRFDGVRRPLRVPIKDSQARMARDRQGEFLELTFGLPPGSYATSVIREVCKTGG
jgi:tRNA pseudouridine13 synthase